MGKSTSCLRIISCGGGSIESNEAGPVDQTKRSKAKKGWSFKKTSFSGRAVTNSVISETPSLERKEILQSAASEPIVSEKDSALHWDEKSPPPAQVAADLSVADAVKVSETEKQPTTAAADSYVADEMSAPKTEKQSVPADLCATDGLADPKTEDYEAVLAVHESDVVVIQSAVRGFLAQKELKSIVKLQAMVRGHLVRCHAVGALRCVQAIAKMQVLVRARYAGTRKDGTTPKSKSEITYTSMSDLLKNSFARQLLESSPKSKPIKIKCDPLIRDSSWIWLERWMSLASPGAVDDLNARNEVVQEVKYVGKECDEKTVDKEQEEKIIVEDYLFNEENELFLDAKDFANPSLSGDYSKLDITADTKITNSGELTFTNSDGDSQSASLVEGQKPDTLVEVETAESAAEKYSVNHTVDEYSQREIDFVDEKSESKTDQALDLETEVTEQGNELGEERKNEVETGNVVQLQKENENIISGSIEEPSNSPVTKSELVSAPQSVNLSDPVPQDAGVEEPISATHLAVVYHESVPLKVEDEEGLASVPNSAVDDIPVSQNAEAEEVVVPQSSEFYLNEETAASSEDDIVINHKEASQAEHSSIQVGESECGTELSITSTLDSPDRLEIEPLKVELEKVVSADARSPEEPESNTGKDAFETESNSMEKGKSVIVNGHPTECANADVMGMDEKKLETKDATLHLHSEEREEMETITNVSDLHAEPEGDTERSHDLHAEPESDTERSHQASPVSQMTFSESQGTPSSLVSVSTKSKTTKTAKSGSIKKRTILSAAKKSPLIDLGGNISSKHQSKELKYVKRRTSFGSPKPEVSDQEHRRDSSTSSSLPSYMQATESARAKANAAGHFPRSSPDVADNDVFLRKRHSLSGTKDKQDSPRLRRTSSQAQSGSKSNGTSPLERKWQR